MSAAARWLLIGPTALVLPPPPVTGLAGVGHLAPPGAGLHTPHTHTIEGSIVVHFAIDPLSGGGGGGGGDGGEMDLSREGCLVVCLLP